MNIISNFKQKNKQSIDDTKVGLKIVGWVATILATLVIIMIAFSLMSEKSNISFIAGIGLLFFVFVWHTPKTMRLGRRIKNLVLEKENHENS